MDFTKHGIPNDAPADAHWYTAHVIMRQHVAADGTRQIQYWTGRRWTLEHSKAKSYHTVQGTRDAIVAIADLEEQTRRTADAKTALEGLW